MVEKVCQETLKKYIEYFENLLKETVDHLDSLVVPDVRFVDPFQDVTGVEEMKYVLFKMFDDVEDPEFRVTDYAWGQDGKTAYLKWRFVFKTGKGTKKSKAKGKEWRFRGISEIQFASDGRIKQHIDHWDSSSQLYEKIPGIGPMMQLLRRRVAAR